MELLRAELLVDAAPLRCDDLIERVADEALPEEPVVTAAGWPSTGHRGDEAPAWCPHRLQAPDLNHSPDEARCAAPSPRGNEQPQERDAGGRQWNRNDTERDSNRDGGQGDARRARANLETLQPALPSPMPGGPSWSPSWKEQDDRGKDVLDAHEGADPRLGPGIAPSGLLPEPIQRLPVVRFAFAVCRLYGSVVVGVAGAARRRPPPSWWPPFGTPPAMPAEASRFGHGPRGAPDQPPVRRRLRRGRPRLRTRAAGNGRSMEEEVRLILREAVDREPEPENLASSFASALLPSAE